MILRSTLGHRRHNGSTLLSGDNFAGRPNASLWAAFGLLALLLLLPETAHAAGAGGGMPYESWLQQLRDSITGPVAFSLGIAGLVISGGVLIFGGELNAFARTLVFLVLVMGFIIGASNLLTGFFGSAGAVVA